MLDMTSIDKDIKFYNSIRNELEKTSTNKWCLIHDEKLIDVYEDFETAAQQAVTRFGKGPYLIRQIGAPPMILPASVTYVIGRNNG